MSKRPFVIFAVLFVALGLAIPFWAISKEGSGGASPQRVAASDEGAKALFQANCGSCHTLARAASDGVVGPDLDVLLGEGTPESIEGRVVGAVENGVQGRMPAGILQGADADEIADFVARVAGQ
jgi:mono/diheme cytochrome c family protein